MRKIEFFQSSFLSTLNTDVKKFIAENSADVVDCSFHILQADLPKHAQFACKLIWEPTTETLTAFLAEQCKAYQEVLSDYEESGSLDCDLEIFQSRKADLLDSVFDVVYEHFQGEKNSGHLTGPDGI